MNKGLVSHVIDRFHMICNSGRRRVSSFHFVVVGAFLSLPNVPRAERDSVSQPSGMWDDTCRSRASLRTSCDVLVEDQCNDSKARQSVICIHKLHRDISIWRFEVGVWERTTGRKDPLQKCPATCKQCPTWRSPGFRQACGSACLGSSFNLQYAQGSTHD
jgi:hypothetical protein